MRALRTTIFFLTLLFLSLWSSSQPGTYILNGSATQNSCNCYTLTPAVNTQSGSVWNATKINLNTPFDFVFNVYLGCTDANGADGMVFILQPISTSIGSTGEGMGFQGITPSIGIALDTWQNINLNDPVYDHISIQANGNSNHGSDLVPPVQASASNPNIEDCQWHTLRISWDPVTRIISTWFDGVFRLQATVDLVTTVFNNDPLVYCGFSAGTGGSNNLQQFCTALNPDFTTNMTANATCIGTPVVFSNSSQSFAPISSYYWDFGDNTSSTLPNPPPHNYAAPGIYNIKLAITGMDGCNSDTLRRTVSIGDYPIADFDAFDTCAGLPPRVIDRSQVTVGTISQWNWTLDGTSSSTMQSPTFNGLIAAPYQLQLTVTSSHGCASTSAPQTFIMDRRPVISAGPADGCVNQPISFTAQQMDNATMITQWNWTFPDNGTASVQNPQQTFTAPGTATAQVTAMANNGCYSEPVSVPLVVTQVYANAGRDTIVIKDIPFALNSGYGTIGNTSTITNFNWSPSIGLDNPSSASPTAILQDDQTYYFTATSPEGCIGKDTINITVFKGSAIFVPTGFTPNNDGLNDRIKPYYVGIKTLHYFTMYNRWGEMVFTTKDLSAGWNGMLRGAPQATGSYVWFLRAVDYVGKVYDMKGTTTIIR
jgi:gliding motility-associated-like protein